MKREARLQRLVDLREKQHRAATADVRFARHELHRSEKAVAESTSALRASGERQAVSLHQGDRDGWLLAMTDAELSKMAIYSREAVRVQAEQSVAVASDVERDAKRAVLQIESTLDHLRARNAEQQARAEQTDLDETARLIKGRSRSDSSGPRSL